MGKVIMSGIVPQLTAPSAGIALADIAEGSLVKINESGTPVEFYVACHNYESGLNGMGRTLLVRKASAKSMTFASTYNPYSKSSVDAWLNGDYAATLDAAALDAMSETVFPCDTGNGSGSYHSGGLCRKVFILSLPELGEKTTRKDGSTLPTASVLKEAYYSGRWWTRSSYLSNDSSVYAMNYDCTPVTWSVTSSAQVRPCFTLPETAVFDEETLTLKGVA